jgi:hypothetical protein
MFVSIVYSTKEFLGDSYIESSIKSFCDSLIREKDKILHLGVTNTVGTSNKALVAQQKDKTKHINKQHPHNNKTNKGPKPTQPDFTPNGDKGPK